MGGIIFSGRRTWKHPHIAPNNKAQGSRQQTAGILGRFVHFNSKESAQYRWQSFDKIRSHQAVFGFFLGGDIARQTVDVDAQFGRLGRGRALSQQAGDDAGEDIA